MEQKKVKIVILAFLAGWWGMHLAPVKADYNPLPVIMTSRGAIVVQGGSFYGGYMSNQVILNPTHDDRLGFDKSMLGDACNYPIRPTDMVTSCYQLINARNATKLMTSMTYINRDPFDPENSAANTVRVSDLSSLVYAPPLVVGDAYAGGDLLDNFAFWGRSLAQSGSAIGGVATDANWKVGSYTLNPDAQSAWKDAASPAGASDDSTEVYKQWLEKARALAGMAIEIKNPFTSTDLYQCAPGADVTSCIPRTAPLDWYLESSVGITAPDGTVHVNGKVWLIDLSAPELRTVQFSIPDNLTVRYHGVGTLIIKGDFKLGKGARIIPADERTDKLGIMVLPRDN